MYSKLSGIALAVLTMVLPTAASAASLDSSLSMQNDGPNKSRENRVTRLTFLQSGDIHGHLIPRVCERCPDKPMLGGLAYMYSKIKEVRATRSNTLLFNTGDTIQGSAEALYTRGQALVNILDQFGFDGYAPGNWDYVYGAQRFIELFGNGRWGG